MNGEIPAKERFRKKFVLVLVLLYVAAFIALINGFLEALLLATIFSGLVYPLYKKFQKLTGERNTLSSLLTLLVSVLVVIVPLFFLLGLIADQALGITEMVAPWIANQMGDSSTTNPALPDWFPFADKLAPYSDQISTKLAELAGKIGVVMASGLAHLSGGAATFFLQLFVMLYAMFFFLISGPSLMDKVLDYLPLTKGDKEKMIEVGLSVSRATIKGTLIIGIIQGTLGGIGFAVAGIGSSVFWGAVMAVLSVLPGIGTTLVWAPAVVYLLLSGKTIAGLCLLAYCAGVVGTIDNVLRPTLVGRDSQMPDLLILLSTLGGLALFGASGLVLGPILAALFMTVLAIYSRVFADWLNFDPVTPDATSEQLGTTHDEGG